MTEVKTGYKQTDIGVIPEDWDMDDIKNVCLITTGDKNTQDRKETGRYPFFVRSQKVENIDTYSFDGEAVLTAGDGVGTGKIFHYINGKFDFHQRVYKMSHFSKRVDGFYFYKYFSNHFYGRIMSMTAKSSVDSVRMEMIVNMKIPLPKVEEQKAIAAALSDVDGLIESLEQLIAKKRDMKTATMQQLLTGKKRLPGFEISNGYRETDIGLIPNDWDLKRLDQTAEIDSDNLPSNTSLAYEIRYISLEDVYEGHLLRFSTTLFCNAPSRARRKLRYGDVLLGTVRPNLKSHLLFNKESSNFVGSTGFATLRPYKNKANNKYIYAHLFGDVINHQIDKVLAGSNYPAISNSDVKGLFIPLPKIEEQAAIAAILSDMDAEIDALEQRLEKARHLKTGMMQELLTGKTRLIKTDSKQDIA